MAEVLGGVEVAAFFSCSSGTLTVRVDFGPVFHVLSFSSTKDASTANAY